MIALVITILVLLILAGVTISTLTGENGLITKAGEAKLQSEIAEEKDIISISAIQAQAENRQGNLEKNNFNEALVANSKSGNKASIISEDIGSFTVKFESNRYYEVDKSGNIGYVENVTGEKTLTVQCVNSKNEILGEYEYIIVTNNYSKLPPAIDKYESSEEKIEGEMTESKTIQVLYYLICNDDTTLVFTGLDSNGNITTNENEIVSYMVGDGSSNANNAVIYKDIKSILKIPENYKGKLVNIIGKNAFYTNSNIIKAIIGDNITELKSYAFNSATGMLECTIGKSVSKVEAHSFWQCRNLKKVIFRNSMVGYGHAFAGCSNWTEIEAKDSSYYCVEENVLYNYDKSILITVAFGNTGTYTIINGCMTIGGNSFDDSRYKNIIIPDSVTTIGNQAFISNKISDIKIGKGVNSIQANAFNSTSIKTLVIDSEYAAKKASYWNYVGTFQDKIYINDEISEISSYITDNYNIVETDKEGYVKYVKK